MRAYPPSFYHRSATIPYVNFSPHPTPPPLGKGAILCAMTYRASASQPLCSRTFQRYLIRIRRNTEFVFCVKCYVYRGLTTSNNSVEQPRTRTTRRIVHRELVDGSKTLPYPIAFALLSLMQVSKRLARYGKEVSSSAAESGTKMLLEAYGTRFRKCPTTRVALAKPLKILCFSGKARFTEQLQGGFPEALTTP